MGFGRCPNNSSSGYDIPRDHCGFGLGGRGWYIIQRGLLFYKIQSIRHRKYTHPINFEFSRLLSAKYECIAGAPFPIQLVLPHGRVMRALQTYHFQSSVKYSSGGHTMRYDIHFPSRYISYRIIIGY